MKQTPDISFITINYNGFQDTCELIESLKTRITSFSYEIIVVDNASRANEADMLKERYPDVISIRSEKNTGFSGGNNIGIKQAKGDYLFIINNDTFFEEDGIKHLIDRLESKPTIGAVSPKIKFAFPPRNIQFAGYTPLSSITIRNQLIGFGEKDEGQYDNPVQTPYLHGAAMILKKEVIEKVGYMPEIYFLYYEELDWTTQMTEAGYELWYEPKCVVYHKESQSTGQNSSFRTYYLTRNRLLYTWRNRKGITKWSSIIYQLTLATLKNYIQNIIKGNMASANAIIKGNYAFIILKNKQLNDL